MKATHTLEFTTDGGLLIARIHTGTGRGEVSTPVGSVTVKRGTAWTVPEAVAVIAAAGWAVVSVGVTLTDGTHTALVAVTA